MRLALASLLMGLLVLTGCSRESPKGGPGATPETKPVTKVPATPEVKEAVKEAVRENTFSLKVPTGATNVTQGKRQEITISVNRGDSFKQAVKVKFETPPGIKMEPATATIAAGQNDTKVFIEALPTATPGETSVTVIGEPETGAPTSVKMGVEVVRKD